MKERRRSRRERTSEAKDGRGIIDRRKSSANERTETIVVVGCISVPPSREGERKEEAEERYLMVNDRVRRVSSFSAKIPRAAGRRVPRQPRSRAFHSIFITTHAPGRRELGGHPVREDRGECKCGLEANALCRARARVRASELHLGDLRGPGKMDADRYVLCRSATN